MLLVFGLISVVVATPFILAQHDLKRLLGYHSVEHVGIVALGLGFGGPVGTYGALLHVVNHGVTKALAFFAAGNAIARYGSRDMRVIRGLLAVAPIGATLLMLAALSLAGVPPFSIFVSELHGAARRHRPRSLGGDRDLPRDGRRHLRRPPPPCRRDGLRRADGGGEPGARAPSPLLGMMLLAAIMILLGLTIPASFDGLLRRATEIIVG